MSFLPVLLWTDALVWLLVAAVTAFAAWSARRPHLAALDRRALGELAAKHKKLAA